MSRKVIDNEFLDVEIPIMKEHILYVDSRMTGNSFELSRVLTEDYKSREETAQREKYLEDKKRHGSSFPDFIWEGLGLSVKDPKEKPKEYWDAFRLGCIEGLNYVDKFFVSEDIDEALEKKFFEFLVENGISITRNVCGSITIRRKRPTGRIYFTCEDIPHQSSKFFREVVLKIKHKEEEGNKSKEQCQKKL